MILANFWPSRADTLLDVWEERFLPQINHRVQGRSQRGSVMPNHIFLTLLFLVTTIAVALPQQIPPDLHIRLETTGPNGFVYRLVSISEGLLFLDDRNMSTESVIQWSMPVTQRDLEPVYEAFVKQKFDLIHGVPDYSARFVLAYQSIVIAFADQRYEVKFDAEHRLTESENARYKAVRDAIDELVQQKIPKS
jgi:hypothetical protein